jgi:hypothetical protein
LVQPVYLAARLMNKEDWKNWTFERGKVYNINMAKGNTMNEIKNDQMVETYALDQPQPGDPGPIPADLLRKPNKEGGTTEEPKETPAP